MSVLLGIKVVVESNEYPLPLSLCKVWIGFIMFTATAMADTYASMIFECLSMVSISGRLSKLICMRASGGVTKRGIITVIIIAIHSCIIAMMGMFTSTGDEIGIKFKCSVSEELVYHPIAFDVWISQQMLIAHCTVVLTFWLTYKLYMVRKRSDALLYRTNKNKRINNVDTMALGKMDKSSRTNDLAKYKSSNSANTMNEKNKSSVYLILLATTFYAICYFPYIYMMTVYAFCPNKCRIGRFSINITATMMCLHGLFNVFIYVMRNKEFKKAMVDSIRCVCSSKRIEPITEVRE